MSRKEIEQRAMDLYARQLELEARLEKLDMSDPSEDLAEAIADPSLDVDTALRRAAEIPSKTRDRELLMNAIDATRAARQAVLRELAAYDAEALQRNVDAQRRELSKRENRQRELIKALLDYEELDIRSAGHLGAAIDPSGLLHVSKTRMQAQAVDAQAREAQAVANRDVSCGQCTGESLPDLLHRFVDRDNLYPQAPLGWRVVGPTLQSIREWFASQQKAASDQSRFGRITWKLIWKGAAIVTTDKYNVVSGFSIEPHRHVETFGPSTDPPAKGAPITVVENVPRGHAPKIAVR
jgi:hypothetical protein